MHQELKKYINLSTVKNRKIFNNSRNYACPNNSHYSITPPYPVTYSSRRKSAPDLHKSQTETRSNHARGIPIIGRSKKCRVQSPKPSLSPPPFLP